MLYRQYFSHKKLDTQKLKVQQHHTQAVNHLSAWKIYYGMHPFTCLYLLVPNYLIGLILIVNGYMCWK